MPTTTPPAAVTGTHRSDHSSFFSSRYVNSNYYASVLVTVLFSSAASLRSAPSLSLYLTLLHVSRCLPALHATGRATPAAAGTCASSAACTTAAVASQPTGGTADRVNNNNPARQPDNAAVNNGAPAGGQPDNAANQAQNDDPAAAAAAVAAAAAAAAAAAPAAVPPPWVQAILDSNTQMQSQLQAFTLAIQSLRPAPAPVPIAAAPPVLAPLLLPQSQAPAAAGQQPLSSGLQPHLAALGHTGQVSNTAHIQHNHFTAGDSAGSVAYFLGGVSGGLAPMIPGQEGPSLEQLLSRNMKSWRPYTTDAEMKEALSDWLDKATEDLAQSGDEAQATSLKAIMAYITTTRDYVTAYGHKLVYQYHKRVLRALSRKPPHYDPVSHGPTFTQAYAEVLATATDTASKRSAHSSSGDRHSANRRSAAGAPAKKAAKRSHADSPCSVHPNSNHTNGNCHQQSNGKKRARQSGTKSDDE